MSEAPVAGTTNEAAVELTARLHNATTLFHAFIYFAEEATEEYEAAGMGGRAGYFASRTAAMGPLSTEMIVATFYNFSPQVVTEMADGVWDRVTAEQAQMARWRAVERALETHVRPVMSDDQIAEAIDLAAASVAGLSLAGRPLAAGNAAVLDMLAGSEFGDNNLVRLWQLVTILREWRGDAHIGLLIAEPLDGAECTVVSAAIAGAISVPIKTTRAWPDEDWDAAVRRLTERGWLNDDATISDIGRASRGAIEHRTNELSTALLADIGLDGGERLLELLTPATEALLGANYFARMGRPAR